jgi:hypothetical protein
MRWSSRLAWLGIAGAILAGCSGPPPPFPRPVRPASVQPGEAQLEVAFHNDMGTSFVLKGVDVELDDVSVFSRHEDASAHELEDTALLPVFRGVVAPGDHTVRVLATYVGRCMGIYDYCRGYRFDVRGVAPRSVSLGERLDLQIYAFEKGTVTTPVEERPAIRFSTTVR